MNTDRGISVHYSNRKETPNIVFFPEGSYRYYSTGETLFEILSPDAYYLITERVNIMVRNYPGFDDPVTVESLSGGIDWLFCAIDGEEYPVAVELFRSNYIESLYEVCETGKTEFPKVGDLMMTAYNTYLIHLILFQDFIESVAAVNSETADDYQSETARIFMDEADMLFDEYTKKCSVRHKNGTTTVEAVHLSNFLILLLFEYCRMKKEGKVLKICAYCGGIFIPEGRRDTKYCSVPQDSGKLCSEIGPRLKYAKKIENDPDYQDHHREMSKLHMALKREKDSGAEGSENLIPTIIEKIEKEKENFKAKMRLNKEVK